MQTPRRFLDFIVDGESLYERHGFDFISPLGWLRPEADERAARRLLRKESPDVDDRVALYVCPEDADLYCGAVTAIVTREGQHVVWRDLSFSTHDFESGEWCHDQEAFANWPELRFPATDYYRSITTRPRPASPAA